MYEFMAKVSLNMLNAKLQIHPTHSESHKMSQTKHFINKIEERILRIHGFRKKIHNTSTDIEFYIVICRQKVGHTHHTQRKNELSMHSKINITIRFSKKRGTQKWNLYCYTGKPPRSVAHRSEARVHRKV